MSYKDDLWKTLVYNFSYLEDPIKYVVSYRIPDIAEFKNMYHHDARLDAIAKISDGGYCTSKYLLRFQDPTIISKCFDHIIYQLVVLIYRLDYKE